MNKIKVLFIIMTAIILTSCQEQLDESLDSSSSPKKDIAGEWQVKAYIAGEEVSESFKLLTSKASSETDSITLKDTGLNFWDFQVKAAVGDEGSVFASQQSHNEIPEYEIAIKILNGKVVGPDSIYFEVQFEDDETPFGNTYQIMGHRLN